MAKNRGIDAEHLEGAPYPDEILEAAITYDARKLVGKPNRARDVLDGYEKDKTHTAIANSELREAIGLDPDGGPDEAEVAMRIDAIRLTNIRETVRIDAPQLANEAEALPISQLDQAPVPGQSDGSSLIASLGERLSAMAELTVERCCEKVGAKLKSRLAGMPAHDTLRQAVTDVPNLSVARILGPEVAERVLGRDDPIAAEIAGFRRAVHREASRAGALDVDGIAERAADVVATKARLAMFGESLVLPAERFAMLVTEG